MKMFLGHYPPTARVFINDSTLTLIEEVSLNFNSSVPIINTDGELKGTVFKTNLTKWILKKINMKIMSEEEFYKPIGVMDIEIFSPISKEIEEFDLDDIYQLINRDIYELYLTSNKKLVGEFSLSSLLYLSSWMDNSKIKVEELHIRHIKTVQHEEPIINILNYLDDTKKHDFIGVSTNNSLIGFINLERILEYVSILVKNRELEKLSNSKIWTIANPNYLYIYNDEPVSKALRMLKRSDEKKTLIILNRKDEALGYITIIDLLKVIEDELSKMLFLQRCFKW